MLEFCHRLDTENGGLALQDLFPWRTTDSWWNGDSQIDLLSRGDSIIRMSLEIDASG